ncbi:MAG TPA: AAA family ATPase, partial [Anaerolineae bacterium]|nr:AAA family ATPase [Anaerolineae bacterium]
MTIAETAARIRANVQKVIVGKGEVIDLALVAVLCEGHILIEDVPGIGKTTLAKALAASLGLSFRRIQFTPDLLPSDVTGVNVFNQKTQDFEFRPGPVFANVVLADEINRATPRTQSAMLEAMQERQVTADGETRPLPRPFLVVATQNPIELEGTFPLPEAQIDRFLVKLPLGYPSVEEEESILLRFQDDNPLDTLQAVASMDELAALPHEAHRVRVEASVRRYIVDLVRATRDREEVELGASPRGTLALYNAAQAYAAIQDRSFVLPDDVKRLVPYVLTHRIIL